MIKPQELRIGNLVTNSRGEVTEVLSIAESGREAINECGAYPDGCIDWEYNLESCTPIPISEEWLMKFGFEKGTNSKTDLWARWWLGEFELETTDMGIEFSASHTVYNLKYVHQLQNLYFALTGKELTIKELESQ